MMEKDRETDISRDHDVPYVVRPGLLKMLRPPPMCTAFAEGESEIKRREHAVTADLHISKEWHDHPQRWWIAAG